MRKAGKTIISTIFSISVSSALIIAGGYYVLRPLVYRDPKPPSDNWDNFLNAAKTESLKNIIHNSPPDKWNLTTDTIYQVATRANVDHHSVSIVVGDLTKGQKDQWSIDYQNNDTYNVEDWVPTPVSTWAFSTFINAAHANIISKSNNSSGIQKIIEHINPKNFHSINVIPNTWNLVQDSWKVSYNSENATGIIKCSTNAKDIVTQELYTWKIKIVYHQSNHTKYNIANWTLDDSASLNNWLYFVNTAQIENINNIVKYNAPKNWDTKKDQIYQISKISNVDKKSVNVSIGDYTKGQKSNWTIKYDKSIKYNVTNWKSQATSSWGFKKFISDAHNNIYTASTSSSGTRGVIEHVNPPKFANLKKYIKASSWNLDQKSWQLDYNFHTQSGTLKFTATAQDDRYTTTYKWNVIITYSEKDNTKYNIKNWKLDA